MSILFLPLELVAYFILVTPEESMSFMVKPAENYP